MYVVNQTKLL